MARADKADASGWEGHVNSCVTTHLQLCGDEAQIAERDLSNMPLMLRIALLGLMFIASTNARGVEPVTLAQRGAGQATACATCHGKDGGGQGSFPRLAGMNSAYLLRQLQDFAEGRRSSAVMQPIAKALSPADRTAMSGYYAALPIPPAPGGTARSYRDASQGAQLAMRGDWSKGVPACVQCHGPGGIGVGENFPAIAGQPAGYISAQLLAWKAGTRTNDPLGLMGHLSRRLSNEEIGAVSEWFAGQPAIPAGGGTTRTTTPTPETTTKTAPKTARKTTTPAVVAAPASVIEATISARAGNARKGRQLAYTCSGCHGIPGYSNAYPSYHVPRIGGQSTQYLANALKGYRSGARKHPTMQAQAQALSDQDIADIAAFLTTLK